MESFLNRYRSITVLLLVILAQLVLLAVQVKNDQDVRFIRIWTVTAVEPMARVLEGFRGGGLGFFHNYVMLHDVTAENRKLREEVGKLKLENLFLKNELNTADRAKALQVFQSQTPSKTLAATVSFASAGSDSNVRFLDRGSFAGVERGMAVVTPDGIVGKIINAYPNASEMLLVTDPDFAAGVISQNGVRGTLKGQGNPTICKVDYVPLQEKIAPGDMLYTSGDDRIFPRGFTVGVVKDVRNGSAFKEISVEPAGLQHGVSDVLILIEGVHQEIPPTPPANQPVYVAPPVPGTSAAGQPGDAPPQPAGATDADKLRQIYKAVGDAQNHNFGEGGPGSKPPDFTKLPPEGQVTKAPAAVPPQTNAQSPKPNAQPQPPATGAPAAPAGATPVKPGGQAQPAGTPPAPRRNNQPNGPGGLALE